MPDRADDQSSLFITRHTTQELLHSAFNALPSSTYGLLGGQDGVIRTVYPFNHNSHPDPSALTRHIQSLESNGMNPLSLYISSAIHDECVDSLHDKVIQMCPATSPDELTRLRELPLVVVRMATRGRKEVVLLDKGDKTELPLLLQVDGQIMDKE
ncbi:MAG: hypothetical protein Q9M27_04225 [Mariprofundaceae bacterium]|nr:hypothetical protein [Mariprofundaceae bacterium]